MTTTGKLTKILASTGTVLVWLPLLAPILLAAILLPIERKFLFDFLMPAELFPLILIGTGLLLWAAFRAHAYQKHIGWSLALAVAMLISAQARSTRASRPGATPDWEYCVAVFNSSSVGKRERINRYSSFAISQRSGRSMSFRTPPWRRKTSAWWRPLCW